LRNPQDISKNVTRAYKLGVPMVLSTIWGSYYECDRFSRKGLQGLVVKFFKESTVEYFKTLARIVANRNFHKHTISYLLKGHYRSQRDIVTKVDYLLPNSPTELARVRSDMNIPAKPGDWVANAVDLNIFDYEKVEVSKYAHLEGCLLSAARVEIRKCQLDLIKAVKDLPYKLVIVGKPSPNSQDYYQQCLNEANENVTFIEHVTQEELAELYKVCKAHALVSWMETPGLSTLEAAVMNSNVIVTNRGDTEFYFEDMAEYVEPNDIASIKQGLINAMENEYKPALKDKIIDNFTWQHTAEQTLEGYKIAIAEHSKIKI
jgi:glycosyltransferase involved in cell wall biosynthesis